MSWKSIDLKGATGISRVCGVYAIGDHIRLPCSHFWIKVLEREDGFVAYPNVGIRSPSGVPQWTCGVGQTELEALQDAIVRIMKDLATKDEWFEDQLEWSDPIDF